MNNKIKIKFVDFWKGFNPEESIIYKLLKIKYDVEISDDPDYIFYSSFGYDFLNFNCIRIYFTGEQSCPDFDFADYAIGMDQLVYKDRYLYLPYYAYLYDSSSLRKIEQNHKFDPIDFTGRLFCSFIYSNSQTTTDREDFFINISKYKKVYSGGKFLNNIGFIVKDKVEFSKKFKFSIAIENGPYCGYRTEKLIDSFAANSIPIYYGDPCIYEDFNEMVFLDCSKFKSHEELLEEIILIDGSVHKQESYFNNKIFKPHVFLYEDRLKEFLFQIFDRGPYSIRRPNTKWSVKKMVEKKQFAFYVKIKDKFIIFRIIRSIRSKFKAIMRNIWT